MTSIFLSHLSLFLSLQSAFASPKTETKGGLFQREMLESILFLNDLQRRAEGSCDCKMVEREVTEFSEKLHHKKSLELLFARMRLPCLILMKEWKQATILSAKLTALNPLAGPFFHTIFEIASGDAPLTKGHLLDLEEALRKWDGCYKPHAHYSGKIPMLRPLLIKWIPAIFEKIVEHVSVGLVLQLLKHKLFSDFEMLDFLLRGLYPAHAIDNQLLRAENLYKILQELGSRFEKRGGKPLGPAFTLAKAECEVWMGQVEEAWSNYDQAWPFLVSALERQPHLSRIYRCLLGSRIKINLVFDRTQEAMKLYSELRRLCPFSQHTQLSKMAFFFYYGKRDKLYQAMLDLAETPLVASMWDDLPPEVGQSDLQSAMLTQSMSMREWIWSGEYLFRFPNIRGSFSKTEEQFAVIQYLLVEKANGHSHAPEVIQSLEKSLGSLLGELGQTVLKVMQRSAEQNYKEATEVLQLLRVKPSLGEEHFVLVEHVSTLMQFLDALPKSGEQSLILDLATSLFDEQVEEPEVSEEEKKDVETLGKSLSPNHIRTLEKIFEAQKGGKRLHQVHVKRQQVEQLFKSLDWMGGYERYGKGSHFILGIKNEAFHIATVLSDDRVPPYQIRQLQKLFKKVGLFPNEMGS